MKFLAFLALVALALVGPVFTAILMYQAGAATTPNSIITPQTMQRGVVQFLTADAAGTYKTLYTAGTDGSRCVGLQTTNSDGSAAHVLTFQIVNTAVKYGGVTITTVLNAGFANGTPPQIITKVPSYSPWIPATGLPIWPLPEDSDGNAYIQMVSGDTLQVTYATAITAAAAINVYISCANL